MFVSDEMLHGLLNAILADVDFFDKYCKVGGDSFVIKLGEL